MQAKLKSYAPLLAVHSGAIRPTHKSSGTPRWSGAPRRVAGTWQRHVAAASAGAARLGIMLVGRVFVFCEYSDVVGSAFRAEGHDVTSCDLLPSEGSPNHYQGDGRHLLREPWDLVIAHPPCNYLTSYTWAFKNNLRRDIGWWQHFHAGAAFFAECLNANAPMVAVENPAIMHPRARAIFGAPSQRTDFRHFAPGVRKAVGLWLRGLPPLMANGFDPNAVSLVRDDVSQKLRDQRGYKPCQDGLVGFSTGTHKDRSKKRAEFHPCMAAAMAKQWGCFLPP